MGMLTFTGRVLVSVIFIASGLSKFTSYDTKTGSSMLSIVEPKMNCFLSTVDDVITVDVPLDSIRENYSTLILAAGVLEVAGGLLFILDSTFGALLLMTFLIGVTPVMHNFWDPDCSNNNQVGEMVNFLKNLSIFGGILAYSTKTLSYRKQKLN